MNARELVSEFRQLGPQDKNVEYAYIANRVYDLRLMSGGRINDPMDFKLFLHELSEAWRFAEFPEGTHFPESTKLLTMPECKPKVTRMPQGRWDVHNVCVRCGHAHIRKCCFPIGAGRVCGCDVQVSA